MNTHLNFEWLFSQSVVERLGWVLVHSLWEFALVALLAGVAVRALRRSSSSLRYGVLVVAMAMSVVAPLSTWQFTASDVSAPVASRESFEPEPRTNAAIKRLGACGILEGIYSLFRL